MLDELISKYKLTSLRDEIMVAAAPCLEGIAVTDSVSLGDSKVGGYPHAPKDFGWPFFKELPLNFIAQINCNGLESEVLPNDGLLLFFYDSRHYSGSIKSKGFIRVIYFKDKSLLTPIKPPIIKKKVLFGLLGHSSLPQIYKEVKILYKPSISIPDIESLPEKLQSTLDENEDLSEAYWEIKAELTDKRFIQVGGYPNPVQYDGIAEAISKLMKRGTADQWKMVFEIYNDKLSDVMWGDDGRLHFFTHIDDIMSCNYENSWMEFQCG